VGPAAIVATYVAAAAAVLAVAGAPASGSSSTVINVTAGKPTEWAFTLSTKTAPVGTVVFRVTNRGARPHLFKVCAAPQSARLNACRGRATPVLAPGKSATLSVAFAKPGSYEYLCTSGAAKGMKGLLAIVASGPAATSVPAGTTPAQPTTSTPATAAPAGDPAAGLVVFNAAGCSKCHSIDEIRGNGGVTANFNSVHPLPLDTGPLTPKQISDLAAYIASR
jgi:plastocyanin